MEYPIDVGLMIGGIIFLFFLCFMFHFYLKRQEELRQDRLDMDPEEMVSMKANTVNTGTAFMLS